MSSGFEFTGDAGCLVIKGELTIYQANEAAESLRGAFATGALERIDLAGVTELDCAGLQLLLVANRLRVDDKKSVCLVNASQPVRDAMALCGLRILS